jgi:hypothetical protein
VKERLWLHSFTRENFPRYPCPSCEDGRLLLDMESFKAILPEYQRLWEKDDSFDFEWQSRRFSCTLVCDHEQCREHVNVHGITNYQEDEDEEGDSRIITLLRVKSMYHPHSIIPVAEDVPHEVRRELKSAFQLYWVDRGSCANKIRVVVELLMDHLNIPKHKLKSGGDSSNPEDYSFVPLAKRIEEFIAQAGNKVHEDVLDALRVIGNVGSHTQAPGKSDLIDAFGLLEHLLNELVLKRNDSIAKIAKAMKDKMQKVGLPKFPAPIQATKPLKPSGPPSNGGS